MRRFVHERLIFLKQKKPGTAAHRLPNPDWRRKAL